MKFKLTCTSGDSSNYFNVLDKLKIKFEKNNVNEVIIDVNLNDLIRINKEIKCDLILNDSMIEIYNDYRE